MKLRLSPLQAEIYVAEVVVAQHLGPVLLALMLEKVVLPEAALHVVDA